MYYKPSEFIDYRGYKMWPHVARYIEMRLRGLTNMQIVAFTGERKENVEWAVKKAMRLGLIDRRRAAWGRACFVATSLSTGERHYFCNTKYLAANGFNISNVYRACKGLVANHAGFTWERCTKEQYEAATA